MKLNMNPNEPDYGRMMMAVLFAALILVGWQYFIEAPRKAQLLVQVAKVEEQKRVEQAKTVGKITSALPKEQDAALTRAELLKLSPRITVESDKLTGSIALKGARFDDLLLKKYRVTQEKNSPLVTMFSPGGEEPAYFAQTGWVALDGTTQVPDANTLWQASHTALTPQQPVTLSWKSPQGVVFELTLSLDEHYMFSVAQKVVNHSASEINVAPYAYINRHYVDPGHHRYGILHEGPLGVMDGTLKELTYKDLTEKGTARFDNASGWFGVTDKYWIAALVPAESGFRTEFTHYAQGTADRFQVDYLGNSEKLAVGATHEGALRLFAGAKEIEVLDAYTNGDDGTAPIPLFDRAVDFGILYFLTKPMFLVLTFFYALIGNFGVAILLLTIVVKLIMFPLAHKSFASMGKMRVLQPEMIKIRERFAGDHIAINREVMELYKRNKVNPASGCLPLLIQMPVFFALYKVLFVTIEMRHAPFFGWVHDLSAPDPSNLFTLFGLIPWTPPTMMHIGVLPILMCITMIIQMKLQPQPTDPVQAKVMGFMPYFFVVFFAGFPAGLVLYWAWSNVLSILQQLLISKRNPLKRKKVKAQ